jgi:hypothetical protein
VFVLGNLISVQKCETVILFRASYWLVVLGSVSGSGGQE